MLAGGRRATSQRNVANRRWIHSSSKSLARQLLDSASIAVRQFTSTITGSRNANLFLPYEQPDPDQICTSYQTKAVANVSKHAVSFDEAKTVFDDPLYVDFYNPDHSLSQHRYIIIGESGQGRLLMVSYTEIGDTIRIISSRELTPAERKQYEEG